MSFVGDYFKHKLKERKDSKKGIVHDDAPLGIRLNSLITLDDTPSLLNPELEWFEGGKYTVLAISRLKIFGDKTYRVYMKNTENDNEVFMQLNKDGSEVILFKQTYGFEPQSDEDWSDWLDTDDGLIGYSDIETPDDETYLRLWGSGEWSSPVSIVEDIEITGEQSEAEEGEYNSDAMLFNRFLNSDETEYLLVAVEFDLEDDMGEVFANIVIYKGFTIHPMSLSII
jgi:hypothetical protein